MQLLEWLLEVMVCADLQLGLITLFQHFMLLWPAQVNIWVLDTELKLSEASPRPLIHHPGALGGKTSFHNN